jgi:DNA-binding NarL/FixJ family response regulator
MCAYLAARPEFTVVGQTASIDALAELCQLRRPDAALVDAVELTVPKVQALVQVHAAAPAVELVVSYADATPQALEAAIASGVTALVPCGRGLDAVLRRVLERARPTGRRQPDGLALTEYDMQVLSLLGAGHSVPEMAEVLQISTRTVENHRRRLYVKLGVGNSSGAVSRATSLGLIDVSGSDGRTRGEELGRCPLVVVHGPDGPVLDAVHQTLLEADVPFVHTRTLAPLDESHWAHWQRGPTVAVLVDPTYDDWLLAVRLRTIVVLSADPDVPTLVDMLLRGACALVRGDDVGHDLASVLAVVVRGYLAVGAGHIDELAGRMTVRQSEGSSAVPVLTVRECDVLASIANGHTIRQTARELGIVAKTVENTQSRLYRKLGARNRSEALTIAHRLGLLEPHES